MLKSISSDVPHMISKKTECEEFSPPSNSKLVSLLHAQCNPKLYNALIKVVEDQSIYKKILSDVYLHYCQFEDINIKKLVGTVLACAKLEEISEQVASLDSEIERIKFISQQCAINAEPSFCPNSIGTGLTAILAERVGTLKHAYEFSKRSKKLSKFFNNAFLGDPCLNGRVATLANFIAEEKHGVKTTDMTDCFSYDDIAFKFTELMYGLDDNEPPNQENFKNYLKAQKDYNTLYKKWVESTQFNAIFLRSIEIFA